MGTSTEVSFLFSEIRKYAVATTISCLRIFFSLQGKKKSLQMYPLALIRLSLISKGKHKLTHLLEEGGIQ